MKGFIKFVRFGPWKPLEFLGKCQKHVWYLLTNVKKVSFCANIYHYVVNITKIQMDVVYSGRFRVSQYKAKSLDSNQHSRHGYKWKYTKRYHKNTLK